MPEREPVSFSFYSAVRDWCITHLRFPSPLLFKEAILQVLLAININTEIRGGNPCRSYHITQKVSSQQVK